MTLTLEKNKISENFGELGITIDRTQILAIEKATINFLLRNTHPLTFNGMTLGVHPVAFLPSDYNSLFDIFNIKKETFEKAIRNTPTINQNFIVTSDPYNLLVFWICHLAPIYIKDKKICYEFQFNLLRLFSYKVFCSVVNNSFRHGAVEEVMMATIASLSLKSDIIQLGSWSKLIDSYVKRLLDPKDRFYSIIESAEPDELFLRIVSESQTTIRSKIVTFAKAYYEHHKQGDVIKSKSSISENREGERIIAHEASVIDSATQSMVSEVLNPNMFISDIFIDDIKKLYPSISHQMLKTALLKINETALLQTTSRQFDKIDIKNGEKTYIGVRILVLEIIRVTIRVCREKRINMGNHALVFEKMRDAFTSSRNLDEDILTIKKSVSKLIDSFKITTNNNIAASLRLAVILYLIYRTILKMK